MAISYCTEILTIYLESPFFLEKKALNGGDSEGESTSSEGEGMEEGEGGGLAVKQCCLLLHYILQCLTKCFLYDKTKFLNRERFDVLLQPLVDQVSCIALLLYHCMSCVHVGGYVCVFPLCIN